MTHVNPFIEERMRKINELKSSGYDPYPARAYCPTHSAPQVVSKAALLESTSEPLRLAGRVIARRNMGKAVFFDLFDDGQRLQVYSRQSNLSDRAWGTVELVDLGDFLGVEGTVFHTRTGELTVKCTDMTFLSKACHPIPFPKSCHGRDFNLINDKGALYRHRHLDLLLNPTSRTVFLKRSRIIRGIRRYLDDEGFIEVETPVVGLHYGGAAAKPFLTRLNALDQDMYLRISPECELKRILCGGFNKVYELGKNFRNEGIDANHNPEFSMCEWYESCSDYQHQMIRFETLVARLSEEVNGTTKLVYRGRPLDLTPPWRRLPILDAIKDAIGINMLDISVDNLVDVFQKHHPAGTAALREPLNWGQAVMRLFEALVEPTLWDPVFVMDHPLENSPLTKRHRDNTRLVERFEPMIAAMEVGNSYSELNDPVEQYERLVSQQATRDEAYDLDEDFVQAMAHGMPQAGGTGLGVDRIVMILTGAESIRDVVFFPFVSRTEAHEHAQSHGASVPQEVGTANSSTV